MFLNRLPKAGWLLAGLAAFGLYKYSKMSPEKKREMKDKFKAQGKKLYAQINGNKESAKARKEF